MNKVGQEKTVVDINRTGNGVSSGQGGGVESELRCVMVVVVVVTFEVAVVLAINNVKEEKEDEEQK